MYRAGGPPGPRLHTTGVGYIGVFQTSLSKIFKTCKVGIGFCIG